MTPETSKQGEAFITSFTKNYNDWLNNPNINREDVPKRNYLSTGALNKRGGAR